MQRERHPVGFYARRQAQFSVVNTPRQRRPAANGGPLVEFSSQLQDEIFSKLKSRSVKKTIHLRINKRFENILKKYYGVTKRFRQCETLLNDLSNLITETELAINSFS